VSQAISNVFKPNYPCGKIIESFTLLVLH